MLVVGFDIGGTKMEGALIRFLPATEVQLPSSQLFPYRSQRGELLRGEVLGRMRVPTERHLGYDQMVLKLQGLLKDLCSDQKILPQDLKGAGFAIPGAVDPTSLKMIIGNTLVLEIIHTLRFLQKTMPTALLLPKPCAELDFCTLKRRALIQMISVLLELYWAPAVGEGLSQMAKPGRDAGEVPVKLDIQFWLKTA
jgi:hypothetical protein